MKGYHSWKYNDLRGSDIIKVGLVISDVIVGVSDVVVETLVMSLVTSYVGASDIIVKW